MPIDDETLARALLVIVGHLKDNNEQAKIFQLNMGDRSIYVEVTLVDEDVMGGGRNEHKE